MKASAILFLSFAILLLAGCQDDPVTPNNNGPNLTSNSFVLKKDGILYTPVQIDVSRPDDDVLGIETYAIANNVDHNTYALIIKRSIATGTYTLSDGESEYFAIYHIQDPETMFGWDHGTLNVLSNDTVSKIMHCQFEATLYNDEIDQYPVITDGDFTIHYF